MGAHIFLVGADNYEVCIENGVYGCVMPRKEWNSDILDLRDKGQVWTFDLGPVQQKNQYKITMSEARELLRLLLRNNPVRGETQTIIKPYMPASSTIPVLLDLSSSQNGKVRYEGWLNAWFMSALSKGQITHLVGEYDEFLNLVPTTFNKVMDLFLTHVAKVDSIEVIYKYTCIELKTDRASEQDLAQVLRYEDWLTRKMAGGDREMIQSILVAHSFTDEVKSYVRNRRKIEEKTVRLISYRVVRGNQDIDLTEELLDA
jgi:hypothetical protein